MRIQFLALCLALCASVANADIVTIDVGLDSPTSGKYRLRGQSAFLQTRTNSGTSGGQLDGIESGVTAISFNEIFPPPALSDYLGFAYFGIIETLDDSDNVLDTSLIVGYDSGSGVGQLVSDTFPAYDEATLVNAFTTSFDSLEFLDMLNLVPANATTLGEITVPPIGQPGTVLDLVAFTGGVDGNVGLKVGTLGVTVVPEPAAIGLLMFAGAMLFAPRHRR